MQTRDASPSVVDYMGMQQYKGGKSATKAGAPSGRYEKRGAEGMEDEVRSVHAEIDYTKKGATRYIV